MIIRLLFFSVIFFLISCKQEAQEIQTETENMGVYSLPMTIVPGDLKPLRTLTDPLLQSRVDNMINSNTKWKRLVGQRKMAVGVVDLTDPYNVKYARLNGNIMMYAASLPKIAILLAAMDAIEKGEMEDSPDINAKMRLMMSKSNNQASTELMDMLGYKKIASVLEDPRYDFYDEETGGGIWVGKRYAKTGERHPDPLMGISHGATVTQVCRYYYFLAYGKLVSFERSKQMLGLMGDPELHHKFVANLEKIAPRASLYRKSGSWKNFHSDSILVWGPDRRYILVALIEDADGENICRNLVLEVDKLIDK